MKKVNIKELTAIVNSLSYGEEIIYFNTIEDGEGSDAYGIARLFIHGADMVLINYLGGCCPCVIDTTCYFNVLVDLEHDLLSYVLDGRPTPTGPVMAEDVFVYLDNDRQGLVCECGCKEFEGQLLTRANVRITTKSGDPVHTPDSEDVMSNDYLGPYTCVKCGSTLLSFNPRSERGEENA